MTPPQNRTRLCNDPATALVTSIGPNGAVLTDVGIDPTTGIMYGISGFNQKFYTVNTSTGQAVQSGSTGIGFANGGGFAADRTGAFFGVSNFSFYSFNKTNGNATLTGATGLGNLVKAADFNPSDVLYGLEGAAESTTRTFGGWSRLTLLLAAVPGWDKSPPTISTRSHLFHSNEANTKRLSRASKKQIEALTVGFQKVSASLKLANQPRKWSTIPNASWSLGYVSAG